jgi:hypothetical protein
VLLSATTGTAAFPTTLDLPSPRGHGVSDVHLGDINRDGRTDAVYFTTSELTSSPGIRIALNETNGTGPAFRTAGEVPFGLIPLGLELAELNGDGAIDLVVTASNRLYLYFNATPIGSPTPTFGGPVELTTGVSPSRAVAADVAGNSKLDLLVTSTDGTLSIFVAQ